MRSDYDPQADFTTINAKTEKGAMVDRRFNEEEVNINLLDADITGENA